MWFAILLISLCHAKKEESSLSREDCRKLIVNHKADDSVEYKAGVSSEGKPVVPADLPNNKSYGLGDKVVIPLEMPLKDVAPSFPTGGNPYVDSIIDNSKVYAGVIEVEKNGSATINGQPVQDDEEEQIRQECKEKFPDLML
ncbi:hypothetical protein [Candidatus Odyssella thessalonicensis]|uniref:hypothetical protein n=1 Tax=Candidatus Odyssella thessalonicensis TaxID=84647 RepID=UPI000225BC51|nr:hypothetical protein [Candidatus Odyssella thessalonicensis]